MDSRTGTFWSQISITATSAIWSSAVEMMDKAENMSAMANMTEWNGSLLNMETEESVEKVEKVEKVAMTR